MNVFLNQSDVQPNLEVEQMDPSNTRMTCELDILSFNFSLTKSGISWTQTNYTRFYVYCLIVNECKLSKTQFEPHTSIFTSNQFSSPTLTLLNETACIHVKVEITLKQEDMIKFLIQDYFQKGIYFNNINSLQRGTVSHWLNSVQKCSNWRWESASFGNITETHNRVWS